MTVETELLLNAPVKIEASTNRKGNTIVQAKIGGRYEHVFPSTSRVSKALEIMTPVQLQERLSGGHYFFVNGSLFDFRDCRYNGFIHTPDNIDALKNTIGIEIGTKDRRANTHGNASLSRVWSSEEINIPSMDVGGTFDSRLIFTWNPFVETIRSRFEIVRLICENGMTGLTSLFNAKIPLINRWEEHLDIANRQIQNKLQSMLISRFQQMADERATLADCLRLQKHALERHNVANQEEAIRLRNIMRIVNPMIHLREYYKENALRDKRLAAQLPSHLTAFDAYNIATELASHTSEGGSSSRYGLDRFANELVFDRQDKHAYAARFGGPTLAAFSDTDAAFFGETEIDADSEE